MKKCKHPDNKVLQTSKDKPWEGTCEKCGKRVKLVAVPCKVKSPAQGEARDE